MAKYIDKDALVAEFKKRIRDYWSDSENTIGIYPYALEDAIKITETLEVKEVNLEKLGEIARHLIAVKEHIEDMRLDKEEWIMLEKIGYPERLKAQKRE